MKTKQKPPLPRSQFQVLLRSERETRAWSQAETAERSGLNSPQLWAAYESGRREPTISQANKLLKVFGLSVKFG